LPSHPDDAQVLPKGVFRGIVESNFYLNVDKRYNPDGKVEDVAVDYNNRNLNSSVFPGLSAVESFFGMPAGSASIGTSQVHFDYGFQIVKFKLQYGVTDRLSAGVNIPYWWVTNKVKAQLNSSTATVGKNPFFNTITPLAVPGTVPLTTNDVLNLLGPGLDITGNGTIEVPGFGFKRFGTWTGQGPSDIEAGFRYQYLRTRDWQLAFTGGVRFPSGRIDDPDNLTDYPFGTGAYMLLFHFNQDFVVSNLWKDAPALSPENARPYTEPGDLVLNGTFRYEVALPDKITKRVPSDVNNPITANKEKVNRDLGDIFEFEGTAKYTVLKGLSLFGTFLYGFKLKDSVSGDKGFAYQSLEEETGRTEYVYKVGLTYSTVPLYAEKKFLVPLDVTFEYRNRFAGSNNNLRSQYLGAWLQVYF
jgi:hypothetical protein